MRAQLALGMLLWAVGASAQALPPPGQWATLPGTNVSAATDPRFYVSGPQARYQVRDIWANSGADLATWQGKVGYFTSGGGHAATPDNSLFWVPLDGSGARRILGPYYNDCGTMPACDYNYKLGGDEGNPNPDGIVHIDKYNPFGAWTDAPRSRHTGSCIIHAEKLGKPIVFMFAGGPFNGPGGSNNDARWVDLSLTYDQQMARPDMGWQRTSPPPGGSGAAACAWDPVQKRVVARLKAMVASYSPDTDKWENWKIESDATWCCDFQTSPIIDVGGRWMYVLGDSVVERYQLDTKKIEFLRNRPWGGGTAAAFGQRNYGGGYASFGMGWHERTKQLVMVFYGSPWVDARPGIGDGSKHVFLIDPATDRMSMVTMSGQVPADPGIYGMYGRFRVVPGTDAIVSVYLTDQNASIGTIPFAQAVPVVPPILGPSGELPARPAIPALPASPAPR